MQGTAADLIKLAMIAVQRWMRENSPARAMVMQVHDELVQGPSAQAGRESLLGEAAATEGRLHGSPSWAAISPAARRELGSSRRLQIRDLPSCRRWARA